MFVISETCRTLCHIYRHSYCYYSESAGYRLDMYNPPVEDLPHELNEALHWSLLELAVAMVASISNINLLSSLSRHESNISVYVSTWVSFSTCSRVGFFFFWMLFTLLLILSTAYNWCTCMCICTLWKINLLYSLLFFWCAPACRLCVQPAVSYTVTIESDDRKYIC